MKNLLDITLLISIPLKNDLAYLDPGSGSFILQLLAATFLGALFVIKASWGKIVNFLRNKFSKQQDNDQESANHD